MPGQDPDAPNLQITSIVETFDALGVTEAFRARVEDLRSRVRTAWSDTPTDFRAAISRLANSPNRLAANLRSLSTASPAASGAAAETVRRTAAAMNRTTQRRLAALDAALAAAAPDSEAHRNLQSDTHRVRRFMTLVRSVLAFTDAASLQAMATNRLLMLGRWGTGKTHSLCDVAERRMSSRLPTLLCLGQQLPVGVEPLEGICRITGLATTPERLLRGLQRMGEQRNCRALLIVDAINEGDRTTWKHALPALGRQLDRYPNVGLVLSCREPFNQQIFGRRAAQQFVTMYHQGFAEREFDAQLSFFDYYASSTESARRSRTTSVSRVACAGESSKAIRPDRRAGNRSGTGRGRRAHLSRLRGRRFTEADRQEPEPRRRRWPVRRRMESEHDLRKLKTWNWDSEQRAVRRPARVEPSSLREESRHRKACV
jgi:hypothetical protein